MDKDDKVDTTKEFDVNDASGDFVIIGGESKSDGLQICNSNIAAHFDDIEAFNSFIATPFMTIELPCGCKKEYNDKQDIPAENVKCEHDNYFIKIGE